MFYQCITTKYHGPTNARASRISAQCEAGKVTVPYDHELDIAENHAAAARTLAESFDWSGDWHGGGLPDSTGYAFVLVARPDDAACGGDGRAPHTRAFTVGG